MTVKTACGHEGFFHYNNEIVNRSMKDGSGGNVILIHGQERDMGKGIAVQIV